MAALWSRFYFYFSIFRKFSQSELFGGNVFKSETSLTQKNIAVFICKQFINNNAGSHMLFFISSLIKSFT